MRDNINNNLTKIVNKLDVEKVLRKAGLPIPLEPKDCKNINDSWDDLKKSHGGISNIPYHSLGEYLDKWISLLSYTRYLEALADIDVTTAKEIRDSLKEKLFFLQSEGNRETKKSLVFNDPLFVKWETEYINKLAYYTAIKALREGYEERKYAISREITRRGDDYTDARRSINGGSGTC